MLETLYKKARRTCTAAYKTKIALEFVANPSSQAENVVQPPEECEELYRRFATDIICPIATKPVI